MRLSPPPQDGLDVHCAASTVAFPVLAQEARSFVGAHVEHAQVDVSEMGSKSAPFPSVV
jgi:hypothetical protein